MTFVPITIQSATDIVELSPNAYIPPNYTTITMPFFYPKLDKDGNYKGVEIDAVNLLELLYLLGIRYELKEGIGYFILLHSNKIASIITESEIIQLFYSFLDTYDPKNVHDKVSIKDLRNKCVNSIDKLFTKNKLVYIGRQKESTLFNEDTAEYKYIYYQNTAVEISQKGIRIVPYSKIEKYVWQSHILQRDYSINNDTTISQMEQFCERLSRKTVQKKDAKTLPDGSDFTQITQVLETCSERMECLKIALGYLLHSYTHGKLKAVVLTDSQLSESTESNGRTGKTLLAKALSCMLAADPLCVEIGGKSFDANDSKRYQQVRNDTQLVVINDLKVNFDTNVLYNDITDGIKVDQKYKSVFVVFAKMLLTTNKTLRIEGESSMDRFFEYDISNYFNSRHSPKDEFGQWFFTDWNTNEWLRFDSFMQDCVLAFFRNKKELKALPFSNLKSRKIYDSTSVEFVEFCDDFIEPNKWYNKPELVNQFLELHPDYQKKRFFTNEKFWLWLRLYTKYHEDYEEYKPKDARMNRRTNSSYHCQFLPINPL